MKLATFFVAATSTVRGNWDKCEEVRKCDDGENAWEPGNECFTSTSHNWGNTFHTNVEYPLFSTTDRFRTNTAVWIAVNEGAEFDHTDTELDSRCPTGLDVTEDQHNCWTIQRRGLREYKLNRGSNFANTNLEMATISMRNTYPADALPSEVVVERMILCDGDVHAFPGDPVEPTPEPEKPTCCDSLIQSRLGDEWGSQVAWTKTDQTNRGQAIYTNNDGLFLTVAKIDVKEEWLVSTKPIPTSYSDIRFLSADSDKCPDQIFRNWSDQKSLFTCNPCDKRIRRCQAWDDPASTDCYTWDTSYSGNNMYRGVMTYPFLSQTKYDQENYSVWMNFEQQFSKMDLTPEDECEDGQQKECWMRNINGKRFFQFTRGTNAMTAVLDSADVTVDVDIGIELLGHDFGLDAVYICESNQHSPPMHDAEKSPVWHLIPDDPAPTPPKCTIDKIDDAQMDADLLIENGMKKGKAGRVVRFWATNVLGKFKQLYADPRFDSCRYAGDFFCHDLSLPSDDHREMYDWALSLFAERLGACGSYRQLEKKLQKWGKMVNLAEPVLEGFDCPRKCHHSSYQKYLLPRIDYATENGGFTKKSQKNAFKYKYVKYMSMIQNEYRESEQCQASVGARENFDCLTVCVSKTPGELVSFYYARLGDTILGREGCANSETPSNKQPLVLKQMDGLNNWLSTVLPQNDRSATADDFWLPKWAENL